MAAGKYRERVTVYYSNPTTNADGQLIENAVMLCRPWAEIRPRSGREQFANDQTTAIATHVVRLWSDSLTRTITPMHWIVRADGTTRLNVVRAFDRDNRRKELELECVEQVTGA